MLTIHQMKKLKQFSISSNESNAIILIQDITDILNNMFNHVEHFKPEEFVENLSKTIISIALDPRVQIALFLLVTVFSAISILINQIRMHRFSLKFLVVVLLVLTFIVSVVNNHFLIIQVGHLVLVLLLCFFFFMFN